MSASSLTGLSPKEILAVLDGSIAKDPFWKLSRAPQRQLLSTIDHTRLREMYTVTAENLPYANIDWLDTTGVAMQWGARYGARAIDTTAPLPNPAWGKRLVKKAFRYQRIEKALWKTHHYGYELQADEDHVVLTAPADPSPEAFDLAFNQRAWDVDDSIVLDPTFVDSLASISERVLPMRLRHDPTNKADLWKKLVPVYISTVMKTRPFKFHLLREDREFNGVSIRDYCNVWHVLYAHAFAHQYSALQLAYIPVHCLSDRIATIVDAVRHYYPETSPEKAASALLNIAYDPERDPSQLAAKDHGLWPVVREDSDRILIPLATVLDNRVERVLLRLGARQPEEFGPVGRDLDIAKDLATIICNAVRDSLLVAPAVRMTDSRGRARGDLDVVAFSPSTNMGLIVEVGGGIRPASGQEFLGTISGILKKAEEQVPRTREALAAEDTVVDWPSDWPDMSRVKWTWAISGQNYLGLEGIAEAREVLRSSDLFEISTNIVEFVGEHQTLSELISSVRDPLVPEVKRGKETIKFGQYTFTIDGLVAKAHAPL
ncbi:hypothetical protein LWF01_19090 [Saxibacter everestensis]|uniref:Uncharacterized protein n=1 Tax=Saxibacter everestensis TaxID=2909229 RepID=A0ABY8QV63_9MICO|nr:hypothetical protein LWF01_19090 [Brevibacteriaceae bacterium ZFBP1038]